MLDVLGPYFSRRKMEKTGPMRVEIDGKVFISHQSCHFSFIANMIEVLFPLCALTWRVKNYVSRQEKVITSRNESTSKIIFFIMLKPVSHFVAQLTVIGWKIFPY